MTCLRGLIILGTTATIFFKLTNVSEACNESVCSDIVTKCLHSKQCNCDMETCSCCKECSICLSELYHECCSCFDICPKPNVTDPSLNRSSFIEEFEKPIPELFYSLTNEPDPEERWISYTYPLNYIPFQVFDFSESMNQENEQMKYFVETVDKDVKNPVTPKKQTLNCTVAYISKCIPTNKCKTSCLSMGATSFRWFHNGCCECIGHTCVNYGLNESRCKHCPDPEEDKFSNDFNDFGQYDDDEGDDDEGYIATNVHLRK